MQEKNKESKVIKVVELKKSDVIQYAEEITRHQIVVDAIIREKNIDWDSLDEEQLREDAATISDFITNYLNQRNIPLSQILAFSDAHSLICSLDSGDISKLNSHETKKLLHDNLSVKYVGEGK